MSKPQTATDTATNNDVSEGPVPANYEAAVSELETLVAQLEAGQLPLDQLLGQYKRGAQLLQYCRAQLDAVESQVKVLEGEHAKTWERDA